MALSQPSCLLPCLSGCIPIFPPVLIVTCITPPALSACLPACFSPSHPAFISTSLSAVLPESLPSSLLPTAFSVRVTCPCLFASLSGCLSCCLSHFPRPYSLQVCLPSFLNAVIFMSDTETQTHGQTHRKAGTYSQAYRKTHLVTQRN